MTELLTYLAVEEAVERATESIDAYLDSDIPSSLSQAMDEGWGVDEKAARFCQVWFEKEQLDPLSRIVITVEKANEILRAWEQWIVEHYVASAEETFTRNLRRSILIFAFIANNTDSIVTGLQSVVPALKTISSRLFDGAAELWRLYFEGRIFGDDPDDATQQFIDEFGDPLFNQVGVPMAKLFEAAIVYQILEVIGPVADASQQSARIAPMTVAIQRFIADAVKKSLPQRTGPRYRRRKRSQP